MIYFVKIWQCSSCVIHKLCHNNNSEYPSAGFAWESLSLISVTGILYHVLAVKANVINRVIIILKALHAKENDYMIRCIYMELVFYLLEALLRLLLFNIVSVAAFYLHSIVLQHFVFTRGILLLARANKRHGWSHSRFASRSAVYPWLYKMSWGQNVQWWATN